jgi:FkbM family methyltransferase
MEINSFFHLFGVEVIRAFGKRRYIRLFDRYKGKKRFKSHRVKLDNRDFIIPDAPSFAWQVREIFAEECYLFKASNENPVILDIGANIGVSVLWFKMNYPTSKIFAFEADNDIFQILKQNVGYLKDVDLHQKAVWISNEVLSFQSDGADGGSLLTSGENVKRVQGIRLRDFICDFQEIDFLKIDIEGAEASVIKDCHDVLYKVNHIFIEYHSLNGKIQELGEILDILTKNGFRYYIKNIAKKRQIPFVNKNDKQIMDLQVEIYGYKI